MKLLKNVKYISKFYAHHGEIIQGIFTDSCEHEVSALVTLPFNLMYSEAKFQIIEGMREIYVLPKSKKFSQETIDYLKDKYKLYNKGGIIELTSNIRETKGYGSSTVDICCIISVISKTFALNITEDKMAKIAQKIEKASDSTMYIDKCILFQQREAIVKKEYTHKLPKMIIVGVDTDVNSKVITSDLEVPDYSLEEKKMLNQALRYFEESLLTESVDSLGEAATISAKINQKYLKKPKFKELLEIKNKSAALGLQIAHSGTLAGLIFSPEPKDLDDNLRLCSKLLDEIGLKKHYIFEVE
ncbi:GHMP family kinase ATP-binding protein [Streptococcus pneumoniae]|uniref:GHMP family kinase ATP-binding protein n=1 Tax=Streptococcus pneumoniae TaxID=1313 RepID=UPI0005DEB2DB|nr:RMD1 family protein [Streptococcus pneumoniae]CKJ40898.1 GHMP kinase [Streptococcus pneumoniae]